MLEAFILGAIYLLCPKSKQDFRRAAKLTSDVLLNSVKQKSKSWDYPILSGENNITYNYNVFGDWTPSKIGDERVVYGFVGNNQYGPTKIGDKYVTYGYNAQGEWVPTHIGEKTVNYGFIGEGLYGANNLT